MEGISLSVVGVTSSGTTAIGLASIASASTQTATPTVSLETWMPLGLFLAGIAMTATLVWKVATHKSLTDSKLKQIEKQIDELEKKLQ